jgi:MFS family permease
MSGLASETSPQRDNVVLRVAPGPAAVGFTINSLGACLVLLARDLDRPPEELVWLSSSFGVGLLLIGAVGPVLLRRGPRPVLRGAALVAAAGAALLGTGPTALLAAAGALLLGTGSAGLVMVTPALLRGPTVGARLSQVNAVSSVCGILGPLSVGVLDGQLGSGRLALLFAVPPLVALAVFAQWAAGPAPVGAPAATSRPAGRRVAVAWSAVVLGVSIEFCFTIWAAARLQDAGLGPGQAGAAAVAFLLGMAVGRYGAPWLMGRGFPVVPVGCAVVVAGTLAVAVPNAPVPVVAGLAVAGLGTAAFYPVTLARLVQVPGMSDVRGPAFGALASGTAILVAPVVLAALGAALDLRAAYLLAVLPLAAALATTTRKEPAR